MKKFIAFLSLVILLFVAGCGSSERVAQYEEFAQCVSDRGAVMYGAYWCPHCQNQKKAFGKKAFENVNYVECDPAGKDGNPELCRQKNVSNFPTWIFQDGERMEGEIALRVLASKTKCELPTL